MKKTIYFIFGISITAGISYLLWAYTGIGKATLAKWLLKKWKFMVSKNNGQVDWNKIETELKKLDYEDHELLFRYTRIEIPRGSRVERIDPALIERFKKILKRMDERALFKRADLSQLDGIVFPD